MLKNGASLLPSRLPLQFAPQVVLLSVLSGLVLLSAAFSLNWRITHDTAWMLYLARLADQHGMALYRDLYDINPPGAVFLYMVIGRMIGYTSDIGLQIINLVCLAALSAITWRWVSRISRLAGWASIVLFGLVYLRLVIYPKLGMQREYLLLIPLSLCILLATDFPRLSQRWRVALIGLMFGLIATVKPHAAIGFPVILAFVLLPGTATDFGSLRSRLSDLVIAGVAAALPLVISIAFLVVTGGLQPYMEIVREYFPLYSRVGVNLVVIPASERLSYLFLTWSRFNGMAVWFAPLSAGLYTCFWPGVLDRGQKRLIVMVIALMGCYSLYPVISGQFFAYHWLPFMYFLLIGASLCLVALPANAGAIARAIAPLAMAIALINSSSLIGDHVEQLDGYARQGSAPISDETRRADEIAGYLAARMQPGDTVQLLDWSQGGLHGLLMANARIATPYMVDVMFFHDVSHPYIIGLRQKLISDLRTAQPRFVIDVSVQLSVLGPDTSRSFPELNDFLAEHYTLAYVGRGFLVYERVDQPVSQAFVVYPLEKNATPLGYLPDPPTRTTLWSDQDAPDAEGVAQQLASLTESQSVITVEFLPDANPAVQDSIERWLAAHTYKMSDQWVNDARLVTYFNGCDGSDPVSSVNQTFSGQILLRDASAALVDRDQQKIICIDLTWEAAQPIADSFVVAAHLLGPDGSLAAQYDSIPLSGLAPTFTWVPGEAVQDRFALVLPADLPPAEYSLVIVVYNANTQERLKVSETQADSLPLAVWQIGAP